MLLMISRDSSAPEVLHVIARMNVGGTARYVSELIERVPNSRLATGCVQDSEIEDSIVQKLPIIRIAHLGRKISPINDFRAWLELRRIIRELKPAIVHTHTFKAGLIGRLVRGSHKRIHTFHGHLFDDQSFSRTAKKLITITEKVLARRTNLLISVGEKVGIELRNAGIGSRRHWASIPPGIDPPPSYDKNMSREILGISSRNLVVGWMARMAEVKNPWLLLEVAKNLPQIDFVMGGGGGLLAEVKMKAPANVQVLGWVEAAYFWSAIDLGISTSDNEGMPISLIEAQFAGVPIVTTNVGSCAEVIEDGVTGIVVNNDIENIIASLQKLILNQKLAQSMSENARNITPNKFSAQRMIMAHISEYSDSSL
jgi:glycosyltransferase involved in cell wall biosynthesis